MHRFNMNKRKSVGLGIAVLATLGSSALVAASAPNVSSRPAASTTDATAQPAGVFVSVSPVRVLDTRPAPLGPIGVTTSAKLGPNSTINLQLAGDGKTIPANATAAMLNVTIDEDTTVQSFLTVWPTGEARPLTSANNALPGLIASNSLLAKLGTNGSVSIYNQQGSVNVVVDLVGYTVPLTAVEGTDGAASAYTNASTTVTLPTPALTPTPVPFATSGQADGSVTQTNSTTFTLAGSGLYDVGYSVDFTTAVAGSLAVYVNDVAQSPSMPVAVSSTHVEGRLLVKALPTDKVQVRFTPTAPAASFTISGSSIIIEQTTNI